MRRLWYDTDIQQSASPPGVSTAVRSPPRKKKETIPVTVRRSKRSRGCVEDGPVSYCPPDWMETGSDRIRSIKGVTFRKDDQHHILCVCFPPARRGSKTTLNEEEYDLIGNAEDVHTQIALKGYANERATLLALATDEPALFWNAVYWCEGDLDRIEKEMLSIV